MMRLALNGAAIIDPDHGGANYRLVVCLAGAACRREGFVRRRQRILIKDFTARGAPSMMKSAVPRRLAALHETLRRPYKDGR